MKRLAGWLGWAVLAVILGIVSFVLVAVRQGWEFDAVLSGSMEPVYHVGSLVVFRPVDPQTVKVGDIISFKLPDLNTPICHRVIDIVHDGGSTYFQTKGDANEEPDQDRVLPEYVKGRVFCISRTSAVSPRFPGWAERECPSWERESRRLLWPSA